MIQASVKFVYHDHSKKVGVTPRKALKAKPYVSENDA